MIIAVLIVAVFALFAVLRMSALVGRDGAVHFRSTGTRRAIAYRKRLERKFGLHG